MLLVTESIYPFSHASFRWSTRFARDDRPSFLFFLLSLPLPFVLTGGQRDILLLFCLFASISLRIPWVAIVQDVTIHFQQSQLNAAKDALYPLWEQCRFDHHFIEPIIFASTS